MRINSITLANQTSKVNAGSKYVAAPRYLKNIGCDKVSFGATNKDIKKPVDVDVETAEFVANSLSTSTSGHRATYMSKYFTPEIVRLITLGVAQYAKGNSYRPRVIVGGDTRNATRKSLPLIRDTLAGQGINVLYIENPVPTPLLAVGAKRYGSDAATLITASHNPWADGGYNLVTDAGAVAPASVTKQIAKNMIDIAKAGSYYEQPIAKGRGMITNFDPYPIYLEELNKLNLIDFNNIKKSGLEIFYDGLQGTGTYVMPKLFNEYGIILNEVKSSGQEGPNPTDANLSVLKNAIINSDKKLKIGLANDGDADRFGVVDENGKFITPNDVILLVGYHLAKNKNRMGDIIRSQATSMQLDKLAQTYGVNVNVTPVGFKYIAEDIMDKRRNGGDILVAGEESGGLTVSGHIPEKDGIIATALIADLVATEGRPISEILKEAKNSLGINYEISNFSKKFSSDEKKNIVMNRVENLWNKVTSGSDSDAYFDAAHRVDIEATVNSDKNIRGYRESGDGFKFVLTDGSTVLVRKSGTEPLVRCYIEATGENAQDAKENSDILKEKVAELFDV